MKVVTLDGGSDLEACPLSGESRFKGTLVPGAFESRGTFDLPFLVLNKSEYVYGRPYHVDCGIRVSNEVP